MSPQPDAPLAIVSAMPEELGPLLSRLKHAENVSADGVDARHGSLAGVPVLTAVTGDGLGVSERAARSLLARFNVSGLVGIGVAGGLTPGLAAGTLLVAETVNGEDGESFAPDEEWLRLALSIGAQPALLVSASTIVVSVEQRRVLASRFGAPRAAADMESLSWARAAAARRLPWVVLRSVSDGVDDPLPDFLAECVTREGGVDRTKAAIMAARHPLSVPRLLELRRRVVAGAVQLAGAVEALVAAGLPRRVAPPRSGEATG